MGPLLGIITRFALYSYEVIFSVVGHVWGVAACFLLIISVLLIWKDKERFERCHKSMMYLMVLGGWLFVLLYLSGYYFRSVPVSVPHSFVPWFALHGTLALVALFGATLLLLTRKTDDRLQRTGLVANLNARHRLYGRVVALLWLFTHIGGIINLYILD